MSFAESLKPALYRIRAIPGSLGLRPYSVKAVNIDYGPGFTSPTETETTITEYGGQNPKVRWLTAEEKTVGGYSDGTIRVGPITPGDGTVGTLLATLLRTPAVGDAARFVVTGPEHPSGAAYKLNEISTDKALHYTMILGRANE